VEDGDVTQLFKKNVLSKLDPATAQTLEELSEKIGYGIQLEKKEMKPMEDDYDHKIKITEWKCLMIIRVLPNKL